MSRNPTVTTWVTIDDGCAISYEVGDRGQSHFLCGLDLAAGIGLTMEPDALRTFLRVGAKALNEVEVRHARERPEKG